jgi:putative sterol carrier protein
MVDEELLKKIKAAMDAGADAAGKDDILSVYEFFKAVSKENEDLAEELEDMDITVQMVVTDKDEKYWIKATGGEITYGEGDVDSPSFTFSCTSAVGAGMLFGEVDATSAYMAGDITVEGNLQDAMAFQEIIELAMEAFEDLSEDL